MFGQIEHLHFANTFSYFFHSYDITTLRNIHPITFIQVYKAPNQSVLKNMTMFFQEHIYFATRVQTRGTRVQHKCNTNNTSATGMRHERYKRDTSSTQTTRLRHQ